MTYPVEEYEAATSDMVTADVKAIPVIVQNFPVVEEGVSQHVNCRTITDLNTPVEILQLDIFRTRATLVVSGTGTVILCHSETNANSVLSQVAPESFGAVIVCPGAANSFTIEYTTTAKLWAVLTGTSPSLAVISERRNR